MSVRRALVDCAVLSLQDQCVLYPCCRGCFSRVLRTDTTWWRCSRCGYRCLEQHLDYRYRLSLRVTRGNTIFGLTVFGSCLNPLFGAKATDLHRLVEESLGEEGQRLGGHSRLLVKAVEDCFIGRHFVFGIKLSGSLPPGTESGSQFIASQISLPLAAAPGCSVVSYYRTLLHQAALGPAWISDPGPAPQSIANTNGAPLLLPPSTEGSFNSTLPACGGSLSLHCSFTRTPTYTQTVPWQQSPGVITSSAEQEEECSFQGGEKGRERGLGEVPGRLKIPGVSGRLISPFSLPQPPCQEEGNNRDSYWDVLSSFCEVPDSPVPSPASLTWAAPMQPSHRQAVPSSARKRGVPETECLSESHLTDLADHVPWEDLPFSESLGEFVCNPADTDPETDHQNRSTTLTEPIPMLPRTLLDITNVEGVTHGGLSPQSQEHKHSADLEEEEDDYNCSADLFHYADNSTDTHTPHVDGHTDTHPPHVDGHTDTHTPHVDGHTDTHTPHVDGHTDTHTPHVDGHTDTHTPHVDGHTDTHPPHVDGHTDTHTPHVDGHTDTHTPHVDGHTDTHPPHVDGHTDTHPPHVDGHTDTHPPHVDGHTDTHPPHVDGHTDTHTPHVDGHTDTHPPHVDGHTDTHTPHVDGHTDTHTPHVDGHTDTHTPHVDGHTDTHPPHVDGHTDTHPPHVDGHTDTHPPHVDGHTDTHPPHVDGHTDTHPPHVDGHTDTHTPHVDCHTDTHTPHIDCHTDTHTPHIDCHTDRGSECGDSVDFVPFSQSTPVSRRTAPLHSLQLRAQRHTPRALTHTPRALRQEPRNSLRAWQRIFGGALKRTAESRRGSSLGEESDMVPPSPAAPCSLRSTGSSRRRISGVKGSEGGSYLRTKGGAQMRAASSLTNRQHADWERHVPHTLTDRQTNQCQTPSCPSLQEKKVSDWSSDPEIEGCDWSRDMFDDSF
uniref:Replication factor A C-terminal domain-containing protein n=1 Tax=Esox lucius TaxID=8010 RepID=A0AAY5L7T4_ESOLU